MGTNEKEYKKKQQQMKDMFDQSNGFHHHLFDVCLALGSILTSPRIPQKHNPILQSAFQNHAPRHHCFSDIIIKINNHEVMEGEYTTLFNVAA